MYQYYTVSTLYEEFDEMGFYIFENVQNALESDALETTRPMTHYVEEPIAIRNLFDDVAYDKCKYSFQHPTNISMYDKHYTSNILSAQ